MRKLEQVRHLVSEEVPGLPQWGVPRAEFSGLRPAFLPHGVVPLNSGGPICQHFCLLSSESTPGAKEIRLLYCLCSFHTDAVHCKPGVC